MSSRLENLSEKYGIELPGEKEKPWGFTIGIPPASVLKFIEQFFPIEAVGRDPSPRFLVVRPNSRLSWQAHERRSELWRVIKGPVGFMVSTTDEQPTVFEVAHEGDIIKIEPQMRHRLIGLDQEGIVAEVWIHTDPNHPSDASDITRIDDDYLR